MKTYRGYTLRKIYDDVYFIQKDGETIYKAMFEDEFEPIVDALISGELI